MTNSLKNLFSSIIIKARSKIDKGNPLTKQAKKWKDNQSISSITYDELLEKIKGKEAFIDQKVDGQTALMKFDDGEVKFGSLGGRVHTHLPVLEEIEDILKDNNINSAVIVGELAGYEDNEIMPFSESQSFIKNPEKDKEKVHWFPYQILSIDDKEYSDDYEKYIKIRSELDEIFKNAKYIHPTKHYKGGKNKIKKAWKELVEEEENEGIVVRMPNNEIYKVKPIFTYDLVIIAVGDKKLKAWPKKRIGNTLVAFMDKNEVFRTAGEVGTGWTDKQREELYDWAQHNKVSEDEHRIWVKPKKIMKVQWERSNIRKNPAYKYENGEYKKVEDKLVGTIVKPRFIEYREDKDVEPDDLRLEQIPNWEKRKKEKKDASLEPYTLNEFMQAHIIIIRNDPSTDRYFPPQRVQMLYEDYKKGLRAGKSKALKYHKKIKELKENGQISLFNGNGNGNKTRTSVINAFLEKGLKTMIKSAAYPDNPDEVVISKSENILDRAPIKEIDVWSYYEGIKKDIIKQLKGHECFVVIKTNGRTIYRRHPFDESSGYIKINNEKDFAEYQSGRTVEFHVTADKNIKFYAVDMDPPGYSTSDFEKAKKGAKKVADAMAKINGVDSIDVHYTGKRGFHIFGNLGYSRDIDEARDFMKDWLKETFGDDNDFTISESPSKGRIALGLAPLKERGGHVAKWSMRVSGLCCIPIDKDKISSFKREEAVPEKVHKKLTGKGLKSLEKKKASDRIINNFLNHISRYDRSKMDPGYTGKFVIHDHDAEKAGKHWDIRIEFPVDSLDNNLGKYEDKRNPNTDEPWGDFPDKPGTVYRSFVCKKREFPTKKDKIYLIETEDHPISYGKFEGTIPEGYGAGKVEIYDKGTYKLLECEGDKKYVFDFKGNKLKGTYALVKYKKGYLWVKAENEKKASTIDYPKPCLCPHIWLAPHGQPKMRPEIRELLLRTFRNACNKAGLNFFNWLKGLYLGGSLGTYTYRIDSDIDIEILYDTKELQKYPEFGGLSGEDLKDKLQDVFNGVNKKTLPGSRHGFSYMVLLAGEKPISDSVYDLIKNKWIRGPVELPDNFDPDKEFSSARDTALKYCKELDDLVGQIYRIIQDLREIEKYSREYGGLKSKRIMLKNLLKKACLELNNWHEFVRDMPRDAIEKENPEYPSLKIGPNWEINNLIFKYLSRYGYSYPVHLILDKLDSENDPYGELVRDFIPD